MALVSCLGAHGFFCLIYSKDFASVFDDMPDLELVVSEIIKLHQPTNPTIIIDSSYCHFWVLRKVLRAHIVYVQLLLRHIEIGQILAWVMGRGPWVWVWDWIAIQFTSSLAFKAASVQQNRRHRGLQTSIFPIWPWLTGSGLNKAG